jgi:hypothetical protein
MAFEREGDFVGPHPQPSSVTSISESPPSPRRTEICEAPASIAFSTSSLSALAGRSTTSPAAMRLISVSGRRRMTRGAPEDAGLEGLEAVILAT